MFRMRLSSLFLVAFLTKIASAQVTQCFEHTSFWTGRPTGSKINCAPQTQFCYKVLGISMLDESNPRGCAYTYVNEECAKLMEPNKTDFCLHIDNRKIKGKLCCCSKTNCNHASTVKLSITGLVMFIVIYVVYLCDL